MKDKYDHIFEKMESPAEILKEANAAAKKEYDAFVKNKSNFKQALESFTEEEAELIDDTNNVSDIFELLWEGIKPFKKMKPNDLWKEAGDGWITGAAEEGISLTEFLSNL